MTTVVSWLQAKQRFDARIKTFEEKHFLGSRWISLRRINEWHLKRPSDFPSYSEASAAIVAGAFDVKGRSQILFLWLDNVIIESLNETIRARPDFRFDVKDYQRAAHQQQSILEVEYLARFWIPQPVCSQWFENEGYPLPPWLKIRSLDIRGARAKPSKAKRGAKPMIEWKDDIFPFMQKLWLERGDFEEAGQVDHWRSQADMERAVADHLSTKFDKSPAESTVRQWVSRFLPDLRAGRH